MAKLETEKIQALAKLLADNRFSFELMNLNQVSPDSKTIGYSETKIPSDYLEKIGEDLLAIRFVYHNDEVVFFEDQEGCIEVYIHLITGEHGASVQDEEEDYLTESYDDVVNAAEIYDLKLSKKETLEVAKIISNYTFDYSDYNDYIRDTIINLKEGK